MSRLKKFAGTLIAGAMAATTVLAAAPAANAATGNRSLAAVLTSDGNRFDSNPSDYDIVTEAALAVLAAKPNSPVKVLTDGNTPVTAFIPQDRAFRLLAWNLSGKWLRSEEAVFNAVAGLGIDTVEKVLLYHVVPGATIDKATALKANGAQLATADDGQTVGVHTRPARGIVQLVDKDPDYFNPIVIQADINKGNKQIAHGINLVLRPFNL